MAGAWFKGECFRDLCETGTSTCRKIAVLRHIGCASRGKPLWMTDGFWSLKSRIGTCPMIRTGSRKPLMDKAARSGHDSPDHLAASRDAGSRDNRARRPRATPPPSVNLAISPRIARVGRCRRPKVRFFGSCAKAGWALSARLRQRKAATRTPPSARAFSFRSGSARGSFPPASRARGHGRSTFRRSSGCGIGEARPACAPRSFCPP